MRTWVCSFIALTALALTRIAGPAEAADRPASMPPVIAHAPQSTDRLQGFSVQDLVAPVPLTRHFDLVVYLDEARHVLSLTDHPLRSADFKVLVQGPDGELREVQAPRPRTYNGHVEGIPGSRVSASVLQRGLFATILVDGDTIWAIEPLGGPGGHATDRNEHIVYRAVDVIPERWRCAVDDILDSPRGSHDWAGFSIPVSTTLVCDLAFDADVEFYRANNESVAETVYDIENVMNGVALIYESEVNITYEIATIVVRTAEADPYTSTYHVDLLSEFRNEWNDNMRAVHRDIAHLMTGKDIDNNVIGSAYTDHMCEVCAGAYGYAFSQSNFSSLMLERVFLTAHEVGHNWGAVHCDGDADCSIMCSQLGGCSGSYTEFGETSELAINATAATAPCLVALAAPNPFPFCDTFEDGLNTGRWSYVAAAEVSPESGDPPSPPLALKLDNCCTACDDPAPDEIRSNFIELGLVEQAALTYFTQCGGGIGTIGSQLFVEYWNDAATWIELNRVLYTGVGQVDFDFWSHDVPADALHDEFRLRFRLEPVSDADVWFVDNVAITTFPPDLPVLYVDGDAAAGGTGTSWASAYDNLGKALAVAPCFRAIVDEIWVREGTYTPDSGTGDRNASFDLPDGLAVLGGFGGQETHKEERAPHVHETVLSGDIGIPGSSLDNSYHVVTCSGATGDTLLDGFVITAGRADAAPGDGGGGMRIAGGSPTVRDCLFHDNQGGLGGVIHISNSAPVMHECVFIANWASAKGGAIYATSSSSPDFTNSVLLGNLAVAFGGGVYNNGSNTTFENCLLSGNRASSGGALYNQLGSATLVNCTLSENVATASVGGILSSNSSPVLSSCILWGNSDNGVSPETAQIYGTAPPVINYTCIEGWTGTLGGTGNTGEDPLFEDPDGDDDTTGTVDDNTRLTSGSGGINTGDPDFVEQPGETDLASQHRVLCGRVDMGAYEFGAGDFDCNQTVDLADAAGWPACLSGPVDDPIEAACRTLDYDVDYDVDLKDFARFQNE